MTTIIPLNLPPEAQVSGALRSRGTLQNLLQDMVQIEIGGVVVDVGWYPDWNPQGEYRVTVFRDSYDDPLEPQFCSTDVSAVEAKIYELVDKYYPRPTVSDSGDTAITAVVNGRVGVSVSMFDTSC